MRIFAKSAVTGFTLMFLALAVTAASANRLSLSHGSLWRATFIPLNFKAAGITILSCNVTFEGSFHSATISKVERLLIGHVTHASFQACSRPTTVLAETLPWHVQYNSFRGTLPFIETVTLSLVGVSFRISEVPIIGSCLTITTAANPMREIVGIRRESYVNGNGILSSLTSDSSESIPCGGINGTYEGIATIREVPGGSQNLLIRLI